MSDLRFYYTNDKNGNPRHVVVATGAIEDGKVRVALVGFHADAAVRRGRPPVFDKPVDVSELHELTDVSDEMVAAAARAVSGSEEASESQTEVAETVSEEN